MGGGGGGDALKESSLSRSISSTKYTSPYPVASGRMSEPPNVRLRKQQFADHASRSPSAPPPPPPPPG